MADHVQLDIVTPERLVHSGPALEVVVPGAMGEFGVLPDHTHFLSLLRTGVTTVQTREGARRFVVGNGFAEAGPDRVVILTELCEPASEIDKDEARRSLASASAELERAEVGSKEWEVARREAEIAQARLDA